MPTVFQCVKGHEWQAAEHDSPQHCPICGAAGDTVRTTRSTANFSSVSEQRPLRQEADATPSHPDATIDWKMATARLPDVPGYEILCELGRGGMGVVYQARHVRLNRIVALKMIVGRQHTASEQLLRFQTEAEAVARLQDPGIVQIYEVGEYDGFPYFSLEFVGGGSLEQRIGRMQTARQAAELIEKLARAIHYAHQRGIVHRDLKPSNILLTEQQQPKIADFGLAKRMDDNSGYTQTGSIMGTPSYMSPEQADGRSKEIGPAADIYSLGAILYVLIAGTPPFKSDSVLDTLAMVRAREPVPPRRLHNKIHRDVETICLKCLEKDPRKRYSSAADLADDLRRFLEGEPIQARPIGRLERTLRWGRRRPAAAALLALLLLVVPLGIAGAWTLWRQSRDARRLASDRAYEVQIPRGLPDFSVPSNNPMTIGKVELGKQLFFDNRLSLDNSVSCASCHDPAAGWSNGKALAGGIGGQVGNRSSPTIVNVAYHKHLFWDGRAASLEEQALGPLLNPIEMGMPSTAELEARLNAIAGYREQFEQVFKGEITAQRVVEAIAAFERTILSGDAPFDRYQAGDKQALSEAAVRGMELFFNQAHCTACHSGPQFTDGGFHNIGIGVQESSVDAGREAVSGLLGDHASFRTPSLREIARTAPYMHDGSLKSLEEVVEYYDRGGTHNPQLDEEIAPLKLSAQQKRDLLAFLREGLSSPGYPYVERPELPE
jgi:cytochrome c peroxidase